MNYLLNRLGFQESDYRDEYVDLLSQIAFIHKGIAAIDEDNWDAENPKKYYYRDIGNGRYLPEYFTIVDLLVYEYKLKKDRNFKFQEKQSIYISATDLANFTYCPIGYSISKTYLTPKNHLEEIGTKKHLEHRLIQSIKAQISKVDINGKEDEPEKQVEKPFQRFINGDNEKFFEELNNSELVFSGHTANDCSNEYFVNKQKMFIGQPDYIFRNKDGKYFVIEEKFKRQKESNQNFFFRNHKVQLASYIYFIDKYKIEYGYLVYWLYNYLDYFLNVEDCKVLRLNRTHSAESFLDFAHKAVNTFNERKYLDLDLDQLNPKKCANCVYILLCGHKNKRHKQVTLPYQQNYFNLYWTEYPEVLRRNNDKNENCQ